MTVRVLVVDDHPIVRGGVVALLQGQPDVRVVGEASNAAEAISRADDTMPDVVLTDLRLGPGGDGVDITKALRHTASGPAVVILTTYDHDVDIVRAVEAGAAGYLLGTPTRRPSSRRSARQPPVASSSTSRRSDGSWSR